MLPLVLALLLWLAFSAPAQAQTAGAPDLLVDSMVLDVDPSGGCVTASSALGIRVVVSNRGTSNAGASAVDVNGVRQRIGILAPNQTATLFFPGYRQTGLNTAVADALFEVFESSEGNNQRSSPASSMTQPTACSPTPTLTPTPTVSPTPTQTMTPTPVFTPTPAPTSTTVPTTTPSGGIRMTVNPRSKRLQPGETVVIQVNVDWNPTNATVELMHSAADDVSGELAANGTWSPSATIQGTGGTQLVIGTAGSLPAGVYTINVVATTPEGESIQPVTLEVLPSAAIFEAAIDRRGEYGVFGPEVIPPYRGGDGFFYESRVNALLQWRPEENTYFNTNTSELLDLSSHGAVQHRLPPTVLDDESGGDWNLAFETRMQWMTDPVIRNRFLEPPTGHTGPWDQNGSITLYGLPASLPTQLGPYVVQRFQRAVFRHWVADTPSHPDWRDTVAVIPLQQAALSFMPEIDPIAAMQIARGSRPGGAPRFQGSWEIDFSGANGFATMALEADADQTARVAIGNPTGMWVEATLIGPVGTRAELAPDQSVVSDWPGAPPLSWVLPPGGRVVLLVHPNQIHPDEHVRSASVMHVWVRPTGRSAMARVVQGMAAVGVPELGELQGLALSAFYRGLLDSAARQGSGRVGCLVALDGDVNAGDDRSFGQNLACAAREGVTGLVLAEAAANIGVGVDPSVVSSRLDLGVLIGRLGTDPAVSWYWWNMQVEGREPGGRLRISRTGAAVGG